MSTSTMLLVNGITPIDVITIFCIVATFYYLFTMLKPFAKIKDDVRSPY